MPRSECNIRNAKYLSTASKEGMEHVLIVCRKKTATNEQLHEIDLSLLIASFAQWIEPNCTIPGAVKFGSHKSILLILTPNKKTCIGFEITVFACECVCAYVTNGNTLHIQQKLLYLTSQLEIVDGMHIYFSWFMTVMPWHKLHFVQHIPRIFFNQIVL